jgi:choline dehydrogenase-like flavoprotein
MAQTPAGSDRFDYVIVGAGSAGRVLANRLSANANVTVAVVEAGPRDRSPNIKIPPAFPKLFHTKYDWDLSTCSQPELKARTGRGAGRGGGSPRLRGRLVVAERAHMGPRRARRLRRLGRGRTRLVVR